MKLSICIPTYNRAGWVRFTLPLWAEQVALFPDEVELVVSDNASSDDTTQAVEEARAFGPIRYNRNATNIQGNPNFFKLANELARGEFVWVVGDDDTPTEGAVERVLDVLRRYPELEYININYAGWVTAGPPPRRMKASELPLHIEAVNPDQNSRYLTQLKEIAGGDSNCFTSIYASVMRREASAQAFEGSLHDSPYSTLRSVASHSMYIADHFLNKPAYYLGRPGVISSDNVSAPQLMIIYILHLQPQLFDYYESRGVPREVMDKHRQQLLGLIAPILSRMIAFRDTPRRENFSFAQFWKRNRRFPNFRSAMIRTLIHYLYLKAPSPLVRPLLKVWRRFRPAVAPAAFPEST